MCARGREGPPVGVTLEPSTILSGEGDPTCAQRLGRGRRAGQQL